MDIVRLAIAGLILLLLVRIARVAWRQRALVLAIWRGIRPRHVAGGAGILLVVATLATVLIGFVPGMDRGLGQLVGLSGNAVFAPLESGLSLTPPPVSGPDWPLIIGASAFLLPLLALLPWLAFVEEEIFRGGLERATRAQLLAASLVFGLAHLVMLVPLGAALALAAAGFAYGLAYRRGYAQALVTDAPAVVLAAYRPTRRARSAATAQRQAVPRMPVASHEPTATLADLAIDLTPERRQAAGVYRAAVWHTATNSLLVFGLWVSLVLAGLVA